MRRAAALVVVGVLAAATMGTVPASAVVAPLGSVHEISSGISPDTEPDEIVAGPDGNLWFTEPRANMVARMTPRGAVTELSSQIPDAVGPLHLTVGADGNLWFSEAYKNQLARLTTSGTVTEFTAGPAGGRISAVTTGPDGNLWYVKRRAVGRMTPAGDVTEFTAGISSGALLTDIAAGPDGNLWFTEYQVGRVGRITPSGQVTEFVVAADPESAVLGMLAAPDGTMWFTVDGRVHRITTDGIVTDLGYVGRPTVALPDGTVWFIADGAIGRVTPGGAVRTFHAGLSGTPSDLARGPDGNIWFTEPGGDLVGRIGTGAPVSMTCVETGGVTKARLKVVCRTTGLGTSPAVAWKVTRKDSGALVARGRKALVGGKLVMNLTRVNGVRKGRHRITLTRGSGIDTIVVTRVLRLT